MTVNEREKRPLSASQISLWLSCGRKYAFRYVHRLESEHRPAALSFGRAVHSALETLHLAKLDGEKPDPTSIVRSLAYDETTLGAYLNQLVGEDWSMGLSYRMSEANQQTRYQAPFSTTPGATPATLNPNSDLTSTLHQVAGYGQYTLSCGAFIRFTARWVQQRKIKRQDPSAPHPTS